MDRKTVVKVLKEIALQRIEGNSSFREKEYRELLSKCQSITYDRNDIISEEVSLFSILFTHYAYYQLPDILKQIISRCERASCQNQNLRAVTLLLRGCVQDISPSLLRRCEMEAYGHLYRALLLFDCNKELNPTEIIGLLKKNIYPSDYITSQDIVDSYQFQETFSSFSVDLHEKVSINNARRKRKLMKELDSYVIASYDLEKFLQFETCFVNILDQYIGQDETDGKCLKDCLLPCLHTLRKRYFTTSFKDTPKENTGQMMILLP